MLKSPPPPKPSQSALPTLIVSGLRSIYDDQTVHKCQIDAAAFKTAFEDAQKSNASLGGAPAEEHKTEESKPEEPESKEEEEKETKEEEAAAEETKAEGGQ